MLLVEILSFPSFSSHLVLFIVLLARVIVPYYPADSARHEVVIFHTDVNVKLIKGTTASPLIDLMIVYYILLLLTWKVFSMRSARSLLLLLLLLLAFIFISILLRPRENQTQLQEQPNLLNQNPPATPSPTNPTSTTPSPTTPTPATLEVNVSETSTVRMVFVCSEAF